MGIDAEIHRRQTTRAVSPESSRLNVWKRVSICAISRLRCCEVGALLAELRLEPWEQDSQGECQSSWTIDLESAQAGHPVARWKVGHSQSKSMKTCVVKLSLQYGYPIGLKMRNCRLDHVALEAARR